MQYMYLYLYLFRFSVAYVSRSGGMSNELNNIIAMNTDGVFEGVAIGGDRYPGSTFFDHMKRYHDHPDVKMLILLGEVRSRHWYEIMKFLNLWSVFKE